MLTSMEITTLDGETGISKSQLSLDSRKSFSKLIKMIFPRTYSKFCGDFPSSERESDSLWRSLKTNNGYEEVIARFERFFLPPQPPTEAIALLLKSFILAKGQQAVGELGKMLTEATGYKYIGLKKLIAKELSNHFRFIGNIP